MQIVLLFIFIIVSASFSSSVSTQLLRNFPFDSKLGKLKTFTYPEVKIDGHTLQLGAGSQIRDKNNFIILPTMMHEKGPVRYQLDSMGNVHRIWLLTPDEAKQEREKESSKK